MPGARNLRQSEAAARARLLAVASYDVTLDLTSAAADAADSADEEGGDGRTFRSVTEVHFACIEPGASTFIELAAQRIRSATLNGAPVDMSSWSADAGLTLTGLASDNTLRVDADFPYCPTEQGLHRAVDPEDGEVYLYSQFETADAQRVFACFDQPDLKAVFTWHVTVPAAWRVVSTMPATHEDSGSLGRTVHFAPSVPMSTYVTAICAGPFHEVRRTHDGIDLGLLCRASLAKHLDAEILFEITTQGLDFFQANFGVPYPLAKYDQIFVPEFGGAMENLGCVTYADRQAIFREPPTQAQLQSRTMVMLHEMAHMWFGDLVTMRWWGDVWLNESFATWAAAWAMEGATRFADTAWASFLGEWKADGYEGDQLASTHPIRTEITNVEAVQVNFDRITYGKGAAVLKQLVAYVGIEAFVAGLREYFERHAWGNTDLDDLLEPLEAASGKPVREFADQWLLTAQVNTLRTEVTVGADGRYSSVSVRQEAPAEHPTLRTHRLAIGLFDSDPGRGMLVRRDRIAVEVTGAHTPITALTGVRAADLLLLNDDDLTYAKVRLDETSTRTVVDNLAGLPDALARAVCLAMGWDMVRDAEMSTGDYLRMVTAALPHETDPTLVATTLRHAHTALSVFADPDRAQRGWQQLADAAAGAFDSAPAGDGLRRIWLDTYISAARGQADLSRLAGWLRGIDVPAGIEIGAELRWQLLQALVATGAAGPADIEAEADADRTTTGATAAAHARAAIPSPEAKAAAWAAIMDPATAMHLRRGRLLGFQHSSQVPLTAPYVDPYFDALDNVWHSWEHLAASQFAVLAYPSLQVSEETLAKADAWLAASDRPGPLRRIVSDRRDDTWRALRARARDASPRSQLGGAAGNEMYQ